MRFAPFRSLYETSPKRRTERANEIGGLLNRDRGNESLVGMLDIALRLRHGYVHVFF